MNPAFPTGRPPTPSISVTEAIEFLSKLSQRFDNDNMGVDSTNAWMCANLVRELNAKPTSNVIWKEADKFRAAVRTLERIGFSYTEGAELWEAGFLLAKPDAVTRLETGREQAPYVVVSDEQRVGGVTIPKGTYMDAAAVSGISIANAINDPIPFSVSTRKPVTEAWLERCRALAALCWLDESTKSTVIDPALAEVFAQRLAMETSVAWLGNATTQELLDEITARIGDLSYYTTRKD